MSKAVGWIYLFDEYSYGMDMFLDGYSCGIEILVS
jgi:hypothetical protein